MKSNYYKVKKMMVDKFCNCSKVKCETLETYHGDRATGPFLQSK